MNPNVKQSLAILERLANEATPPPTIDRQDFLDKFYPKQQKVITDEYRYGTIFGGKRSGKSSVLAGLTFYTDNFVLPDRPGIIFLCSTTAEHAKTLFLKRLQSICKKYRIKNWHYQLSKSRITTPHNLIIFVGLKDLKSVYDQQGAPVKLCIIDEAQFVKDDILKAFIDLVVSLGMFDFHPFSKTVFAGNPFPVHSGYMWDELQNPEIKHFNLNLTDNTFFSEKEKMNFITAELKKRGETMQTLSNNTRRLIFGEHIADHDKLILNFTEKDEFDYLTPQQINSYDCFMGIDLGFDDKTAIACAYYDYISRDIFLDYEFQEQHMTILPLADKIKSLLPSYITHGQNIIDTQGGGKQTAFSLIQDHGIPFIPSKKTDKMHYVSLLRSYNKKHKLKIKKNSLLKKEANHIIFGKHNKSLDDDHFHSDIFHAVLYAFRFIYTKHIREKKQEKPLSAYEDFLQRYDKQHKYSPPTLKKENYQ